MFRRFDICIVLFLLLNACYWVILNALNTIVAPYVYFVLPAIFIVPVAMYMNFSSMVVVILITAFAVASATPANSFFIAIVWLMTAFIVNSWRFKFRALDLFSSITLMQIVNLFVIIFYAFAMPIGTDTFFEYVKRLACDTAFSGVLLCLCSGLCLSVPVSIMSFFGLDITMNEDI